MLNNNSSDHQILRSGIDPGIFYGNLHSKFKLDPDNIPDPIVSLPSTLCGPSVSWQTFKKQQEALDYVVRTNLDLLPFTYQEVIDGTRLFLAAHPVAFWCKDQQRKPGERHAYEIIQENRPCKLYFDLEFEPSVNHDHDGDRMVNTFINVVCSALQNKYGITCGISDVLILDSTSSAKFSCHLIFPNVIFENNYHAGNFVKRLCHEIRFLNLVSDLHLLKNVKPCDEVNELSVLDSKDRQKLFCDEAVYSKNRHFRLFKSSKYGKNLPLVVSQNNKFQVIEDIENTEIPELTTFLCSLITYCPSKATRLTYECDSFDELSVAPRGVHLSRKRCEGSTSNPFVEIDRCISDIIRPGSIYRSRYYPEKRILVYDIAGNRYCRNIGRQHKSNNIKYVVDVNTLSYYQKCYDPDCADFRSRSVKLPVDESIFINHDIDDGDFLLLPPDDSELGQKYLSYRESVFSSSDDDEDLVKAAERCELLNRSRGKILIFQDADDDLMAHVAEGCEKLDAMDDAYDADDDDELMVSVAEECESMLLNGKRKLSEHLADDESARPTEQMDDDEGDERHHDKRKMIRPDDLMVAMTENCRKSLNLGEFQRN